MHYGNQQPKVNQRVKSDNPLIQSTINRWWYVTELIEKPKKRVTSRLIFNRVCFDCNSKITVFFDHSYEKDTSELKDNIYQVFQLNLVWVETYLWQQAFPWTQWQPWLKGKERDCAEEIKGKTGTGSKCLVGAPVWANSCCHYCHRNCMGKKCFGKFRLL